MYSNSRTWARQDGGVEKRKRAIVEDFSEDRKRARPEDMRQTREESSHIHSARDRESRGSPGDYPPLKIHDRDFPKFPVTRDSHPSVLRPDRRSRSRDKQHSYNSRDYPLSPLSRSPENVPEESTQQVNKRK